MRADEPLGIFSQTEFARPAAYSCIETTGGSSPPQAAGYSSKENHLKGGRLSFRDAHAADRSNPPSNGSWCSRARGLDADAVTPCRRASNLLQHFHLSLQNRLAKFTRAESQNAWRLCGGV